MVLQVLPHSHSMQFTVSRSMSIFIFISKLPFNAPNEFLAAFHPSCCYKKIKITIRGECKLNQTDAMDAIHFLVIINEPFRESSRNDGSRICWESVLILRRMLLVIMKAFILSPIVKLYPIAVLLFIFRYQQVITAPYSDRTLKGIELVSLDFLAAFVFVIYF